MAVMMWRDGFNRHGKIFYRYKVGGLYIHEEPDNGFAVVIYPGPTACVRWFGFDHH
jgi:hypothetical protein